MVVASKAPHPAQAPRPFGGLDMLRLGCPTHGRVRGDERRPVFLKEGDKLRSLLLDSRVVAFEDVVY